MASKIMCMWLSQPFQISKRRVHLFELLSLYSTPPSQSHSPHTPSPSCLFFCHQDTSLSPTPFNSQDPHLFPLSLLLSFPSLTLAPFQLWLLKRLIYTLTVEEYLWWKGQRIRTDYQERIVHRTQHRYTKQPRVVCLSTLHSWHLILCPPSCRSISGHCTYPTCEPAIT